MPKYKLVTQDDKGKKYIAFSEDIMRTPNRDTFPCVFNLLQDYGKAHTCDGHYITLPKEYLY